MRGVLAGLLILLAAGCRRDGASQAAIAVEKFETVTGPAGDGGFEGFTLVSAGLRGGRRIAFQPNPPSGPPMVIDSTGRAIDTLAKRGSGPGEAQWTSRVLRGTGDTVYVVDAGRVLVYSPELKFLRSFPVEVHSAWSGVMLPSGDLALASATFGVPEIVSVVSPGDGAHRWGVTITPDPASHLSEVRCVAVGPDGTLWTLRATGRLEFEHFGKDGERLGGVTATPEWYPSYDRLQTMSRTVPSSPTAAGFWVDSLGRAWVVGTTSDPKWAQATGKDQPGEGGTTYFVADHPEQVRDGVIDVIDLATGRSVMSVRSDVPYGIPIEPWVIQRSRTDADGWQQVDLYRVAEVSRTN